MNILVICQYYYPEPFRIHDLCEELVLRGHAVTVVTGEPNYPDGDIYQGYENHQRADEHDQDTGDQEGDVDLATVHPGMAAKSIRDIQDPALIPADADDGFQFLLLAHFLYASFIRSASLRRVVLR